MDNKQELLEMAMVAKEAAPQIKELISELQRSYGPLLEELLENLAVGLADVKTTHFNRLISNDFTREEALALTLQSFKDIVSIQKQRG